MALVLKPNGDDRPRKRSWIPPRVVKALAIGQLFVTVPVLALAVLGFSYIDEVKYQSPPLGGFNVYKNFEKTKAAVENYRFPLLRMLGYNPEFKDVYLDIKQVHYRKLEFTSLYDLGLRRGIKDLNTVYAYPTTRHEVEVPGTLRIEGQAVPVKLRLKGDRTLHWNTPERWSFRVKVRGDRTIFGMESFSMHRAVARNYIHEWLFHTMLKREGLIGLRYEFITLHVNGRSQGVYVVEEHFRKQLVEDNRRREGPIFSFAEESSINPSDIWAAMPVVPYQDGKWQRDDPETIAYATGLIEGFRRGRLDFQDVFDVELWGRFFAICDLTESFHGAIPKSVKLYFNPVTQRIEPIGFDGHFRDKQYPVLIAEIGDWRDADGLWGWGSWFQKVFHNDIADNHPIWEAYVRNLERLSRPAYLEALFKDIGDDLERNLDFIYTEFPYADLQTGHPLTGLSPTFFFTPETFFDRQNFIRARLRPEAGLFAYVASSGADYIDLNVSNRQKLPLEILEANYAGRTYRSADTVRLDGKQRAAAPESRVIRLFAMDSAPQLIAASTQAAAEELPDQIAYKVVGASDVISRGLFNWYAGEPAEPPAAGKLVSLESQAFIEVDRASKTVAFRAGEWTLRQDLVIPSGYSLTAGPGTVIDLVAGARIVSYGAARLEGLAEDPVVIRSSDGSGQGLIVLHAGASSSIRHVAFQNLGLDPLEHWKLTSIVTFYESDVTFEHAQFCNNNSEDALNIIRSQFAIRDSLFSGTFADAIDSDFSDGRIDRTDFLNIGNDSIDFSGASAVINDVDIRDTGDKGISVGENSRVEMARVAIDGANIAVAIKDSSALDAINLTIEDATVGFALYQKKPEFGPASANLWRTLMKGVTEAFWVEAGSTLIDDGEAIAANRTEVLESLPPVAKPAVTGDCRKLVAQNAQNAQNAQ